MIFIHWKLISETRSNSVITTTIFAMFFWTAYVNELLLANIIQTIFPDSIRQYRAKWLGKYIIDIFIPSKNIAVEYQEEQHYKPVKRFGGEIELNQQRLRDDIVRQKCKQNGIILIEWPYYDKVTEETVKKVFQQYVK